ncbi:MLO-like protein 2 [Frankliniella fusca]|uniref:MLO-like protein 2 n=1 Tax=Frankliniella fusca TaxID=407009 RepID=A0AAE1LPL9_9NEOP|nr:MLO-like protein 2 [Frankliniella fusca]
MNADLKLPASQWLNSGQPTSTEESNHKKQHYSSRESDNVDVDELDVKHKIKTETFDPGYSAEPEKKQEMPERKMHSKVNIEKIVSSTEAENPLCNKYTYAIAMWLSFIPFKQLFINNVLDIKRTAITITIQFSSSLSLETD